MPSAKSVIVILGLGAIAANAASNRAVKRLPSTDRSAKKDSAPTSPTASMRSIAVTSARNVPASARGSPSVPMATIMTPH